MAVNVVVLIVYFIFLNIDAQNPNTTVDSITLALRFIVWALQLVSFGMLLYSTLKIRNLVSGSTILSRQIDINGIRFVIACVILLLALYLVNYTMLSIAELSCFLMTPVAPGVKTDFN